MIEIKTHQDDRMICDSIEGDVGAHICMSHKCFKLRVSVQEGYRSRPVCLSVCLSHSDLGDY